LEPANEKIVLGEFEREGRTILILVNVAKEPYKGVLKVDVAKPWTKLDPATGELTKLTPAGEGIPIQLDGSQTILLIR